MKPVTMWAVVCEGKTIIGIRPAPEFAERLARESREWSSAKFEVKRVTVTVDEKEKGE